MPLSVEEREPGVYVRSNRPDTELDFLWDKDRRKHVDHDRFHLGFFAGGAVVGSLITLAACLLVFSGDKFFAPAPKTDVPVIEQQVAPPPQKAVADSKADKKPDSIPFFGTKSEPQKVEKTETPVLDPDAKARVYEVQSGDTLGAIAIKFYDSSNPAMVDKIQRANKMNSPDDLAIGQRLIIPPKSY